MLQIIEIISFYFLKNYSNVTSRPPHIKSVLAEYIFFLHHSPLKISWQWFILEFTVSVLSTHYGFINPYENVFPSTSLIGWNEINRYPNHHPIIILATWHHYVPISWARPRGAIERVREVNGFIPINFRIKKFDKICTQLLSICKTRPLGFTFYKQTVPLTLIP